MKPILVLAHGWGFDASVWRPLQTALPDLECLTWDLGFRGTPSSPALPADRPVIAVGHSLGLLWLLQNRPCRWDRLVAINGFTRFAKADNFQDGVPSRLLDRMIAKLTQTPAAVTSDFLARCGLDLEQHPIDGASLDADRLTWGLNALAGWDQRAAPPPDLVLAGRNDPIVSSAMTQAAFPASFASGAIRWHDGGHLLPLTAPDWCAARLRELLESL